MSMTMTNNSTLGIPLIISSWITLLITLLIAIAACNVAAAAETETLVHNNLRGNDDVVIPVRKRNGMERTEMK